MTGKVKPGMTGKSLGREGLGASGLARTGRSSWKGPGGFQDGNDGKVPRPKAKKIPEENLRGLGRVPSRIRTDDIQNHNLTL